MRIATFNAASIRARLPSILDWIAENEPDVLAVQETKVEDDKFPFADFEEIGYGAAINGQKSWNGVATLSRHPIRNPMPSFNDDLFPNDARVLTAEIDGVTIVNTYVPNGSAVGSDKFDYKLRWLERFDRFLRENFQPDQPLIWLGDINIAPTEKDVFDAQRHYGRVGFHPDELSRLETIVSFGLQDLFRLHHEEPKHYTFWEFTIPKSFERNLGWRIDHIYGTAPVAAACTECFIDREARTVPKPSDHTYVIADIDL